MAQGTKYKMRAENTSQGTRRDDSSNTLGHAASGVDDVALGAWVHAVGSSRCSLDSDPEESRAWTILLNVSFISWLDGGALRWVARGLQSPRDASPRNELPLGGQAIITDAAFLPKLEQALLIGGSLVRAAGATLGNWKNGIGATAGLPSSSRSMSSDVAAVYALSHCGSSSASRDSELRFNGWGGVLLGDVLSLPV